MHVGVFAGVIDCGLEVDEVVVDGGVVGCPVLGAAGGEDDVQGLGDRGVEGWGDLVSGEGVKS